MLIKTHEYRHLLMAEYPLKEETKTPVQPQKHAVTYRELLRRIYHRFLQIRGRPREIALGLALGLFVGMSPTLGFQMVIAVSIAALLKWNKISAAIGVWVTNPVTAPIIYTITYVTGAKFLGHDEVFQLPKEFSFDVVLGLFRKTPEVMLAMTAGGIIIGLPVAIAGYYLAYALITRYRRHAQKRSLKRALKQSPGQSPPAP
ncbi:MAG: DUF2062 domain-containing protein [Sedimentisphaerales bacterium]|nr:DUF2062 domain-containing protein [Sedimentisphaerales bacterium]